MFLTLFLIECIEVHCDGRSENCSATDVKDLS